jgi:hypothetical protein
LANVSASSINGTAFRTFANANAASQQTQINNLNLEVSGLLVSNIALFSSIASTNSNVAAANIAINGLRSNITAANAAIISSNVAMTAYVDARTYSNANVFGFLQTYTPQQVGNITANGIGVFDALNLSPNIITMFNDGNINAGNVIVRDYFYGPYASIDNITVGNIEITNNISFAGNVTGNAVGVSSTYEYYYVNAGGGIFWANGENYSNAFVTSGNLTFSDTTIGTSNGASSGIILNSAGSGEIAMLDYVGINNTNPGYWLHIGDGSPGTGNNTGNISIDFRNNTGTQRGSTILGYAWWDAASTGTDNRGTGPHSHFGIYKNDDTFDNKFIEFNYTSGNANVGNLTATSLTVLTNVSYTMANYQNWTSNVSTIGAALDQLALRLKNAGF